MAKKEQAPMGSGIIHATPQPQEGLTEEQVIEKLGEGLIGLYDNADYWGIADKAGMANYRKRDARSLISQLRTLGYSSPQEVKEQVKQARREVVDFISDLIIGVEGCAFEERLDGDKGCIVLDMNENQWKAKQKEWEVHSG